MKDRNVTIYGLMDVSPDQSVTGVAMRAVQVSDGGMLYAIMTIGGNGIEATSPWESGNDQNEGWRGPFMPVTAANFMIGSNSDLDSAYYSAMCRQSPGTAGVTQNAAIVDQLVRVVSNHSPAVNTAAVLDLSAGVDNPVVLKRIHGTINAVAAIAAPIALQVIEDFGGANTVVFQKRYTCPAGQTVDIEIDCNFFVGSTCRVTIADPGATNFVDLNVEWLGDLVDPPFTGDATPL